MCQLTYSNLQDPYLNSLMIYLLGKIGSEKHDDGTGFICTDNKIWKTEKAAKNITNLGNIINLHVLDNKPVPFHIRQATYGIEVTKENAHPFIGKHFILMHNGTLLPRDGKEPDDKKHDSDSLKFLNSLDECKDINPSGTFEELFNAAMGNFAGKFAFIIREKETNLDYIIRGRTAELYISKFIFEGKERGYVVNTSKETMKSAFLEFVNIWDIFNDEEVGFSEPILLEMESIFSAETEDIKRIGKTLEITPVKKSSSPAYSSERGHNYWNADDDESKDGIEIIEKADRVYKFLRDHNLGLVDYQIMVMIIGGISVLELTEEDASMFIDYVIPKISANKAIRIQVKNILGDNLFPPDLYKKYDLEYPWMVNEGSKVVNALKEYVKKI